MNKARLKVLYLFINALRACDEERRAKEAIFYDNLAKMQKFSPWQRVEIGVRIIITPINFGN